VIGFSSNIGTVKVGQRLGPERMVRYAGAFGYGQPTGIELPGEAAGLLKQPARWTSTTIASVPYGQEVAVTTIQSAVAYAAIANGGWLPKPTLVKELRQPDGVMTQGGRSEVRQQVISSETGRRLKGMLTDVVVKGTGTDAQVPNYAVAGKTGTAQKPLRSGRGYDPVNHVASFIGFLPADRPRLLIAVVIDSPNVQWGGLVAGPAFREVGQNLTAYLGIVPGTGKESEFAKMKDQRDNSEKQGRPQTERTAFVPTPRVGVPTLDGLDAKACQEVLARHNLRAVILGQSGRVLAQRPASGMQVTAGSPVTVYLGDASQEAARAKVPEQVVVPNFSGQSLRNALQMLAAYGFQARVSGSGIVYGQQPRPNTTARLGSICTLNCKDPEARP